MESNCDSQTSSREQNEDKEYFVLDVTNYRDGCVDMILNAWCYSYQWKLLPWTCTKITYVDDIHTNIASFLK